ncbi:MAG TPA: acetyl-CoA carboxylase biotin carboxyl carrier protein subunit [Blastocatellia bacterium]|nr:acetyl-CoA carboxylase biotin carboxyl carrier protein subunit [Blastocatellia bacterium]
MRYEADIDGHQINLELERRNGRIVAVIGQRSYDLEVSTPQPGVYLMFQGDEVHEAHVWSADANSLRVTLRGRLFTASIIDRKQRRTSEHRPEGQQQLTAPMPGKVVRILLKPGDEVAAGQGIIVVEAMKMQNEIKSPKAGRILEVRVAEGETVNNNQVLAVVE